MQKYWVDSNHRQIQFFRKYANSQGTAVPKDAIFLANISDDGTVSGISALDSDPQNPVIHFFYVAENYRNQGIGSQMMQEIIKASESSGISSLRCILNPDKGLEGFFEKQGFDIFPGESMYNVPFGALYYSENYVKNISRKSPGKAKAISGCSDNELTDLKVFFTDKELSWDSGYNRDVSIVDAEGREVDGLMLCNNIKNGISLSYLYSEKNKPASLLMCFRALDKLITADVKDPSTFNINFALGGDRNYEMALMLSGDNMQVEEELEEILAVKTF